MMVTFPRLLVLLSVLTGWSFFQSKTVVEQQGRDRPVVSAKPAAGPVVGAGSLPLLSDADKIALRDLQVEQDRWIIELGDLEAAYLRKKIELRAKIDQYHDKVEQLAYDLAIKQKVDPKEFVLNMRTMTWEKKEPAKKQGGENPKENKQ